MLIYSLWELKQEHGFNDKQTQVPSVVKFDLVLPGTLNHATAGLIQLYMYCTMYIYMYTRPTFVYTNIHESTCTHVHLVCIIIIQYTRVVLIDGLHL